MLTAAMAGVAVATPASAGAEEGDESAARTAPGPVAWLGPHDWAVLNSPLDQVLGGYVMMGQHLPGLGGTLSTYQWMASFLQTHAAARGRFAALGFYTTNYWDPRAPIAPWFDDGGWDRGLDGMRTVAGIARAAGVGALAFDTEPYAGIGGVKHEDQWSDVGPATDGRDTEEVHAQARARGAQVGDAIAGAGITELLAYGTYFPQSYWADVQRAVNRMTDAHFDHDLGVDFWDGVLSSGIQKVTFEDAVFYKGNIMRGDSWASAFDKDRAATEAYWQDRFGDNASKARWAPMLWIDHGAPSSSYESRVLSPAEEQQRFSAALSKATGPVVMYGQHFAGGFDYAPYVPALRAANAS